MTPEDFKGKRNRRVSSFLQHDALFNKKTLREIMESNALILKPNPKFNGS
jgi:hypothetical protein